MLIITAFYMSKNMKERDTETDDIKTKIKILEMKTSTSKMETKQNNTR